MAGPMKRAWPPLDRDSDGETAAAFEAAVAEIKQAVVRSGEVLVSAKEDLSDHQRWLKAQAAAVEADRERLGRWLQRQRERQEAVARREQTRARRQAKLQAAVRSLKDRVAAAIFAVRTAVWRSFTTIAAGLNSIDAMAAGALRWIGARLRDAALTVGGALWRTALLAGRTLRTSGLFVASFVASSFTSFGALFRTGAARVGAKVSAVTPVAGASAARLGAKVHTIVTAAGNFLARCFNPLAASTRKASQDLRRWLQARFPTLWVKAENLRHSLGVRLAPAFSSVAARAHALAPNFSERIAEAGTIVGTHLRKGALRTTSLLAWSKAAPDEGENAVSLSHRARSFDLGQMLIIAGALLIVCGALMLGGGLFLRAGKPSTVTAISPSEPIAWLFEHDNLELDERSVFAFAAGAEGVRIKGFAIGGINLSEQTLDSVGSVIKTDHQAKDVKLAMRVALPAASEIETFEPGVPGTIPPQGQFVLLFAFPEEGGMTPGQVLSTFGGVMLKVRYEVGGKEMSFIHYLSPTFLERQLAEIAGEAKGS